MPGTSEGAKKAKQTREETYGKDYYSHIGKLNKGINKTNSNKKNSGFASNQIGPDGLTGRERAAIKGRENISKYHATKNKVIFREIDNL